MDDTAGEGRESSLRASGGDESEHDVLDARAAEGLAHLQSAARELIQAARAMLDVAEELVDDPATVTVVADAMGAVVRTAARTGRKVLAGADGPTGDDAGGSGGRSNVERIKIG